MTKITPSLFLATFVALGLQAPAQAQLSRTAVSAARGNDANNCDVATPCRTFQRAHNATNDQGEVTVLDPGGYGSLNITKSISIVNDGVGEASILVSGGAVGITITGGDGAYVNLRGITVQGIGFGGGTGLVFNKGFSLTIENCVFRNHTGDGITFQPIDTAVSNLSVSNTRVADNGGTGIRVKPQGGSSLGVNVVLKGVQSTGNSGDGIGIFGDFINPMGVTVTDTLSANNSNAGFRVKSPSGGTFTNLMVTGSTAAGNVIGLLVEGAPAQMQIGHSTVSGNSTTWTSTGSLASFGDNYMAGNADGGGPAIPLIGTK